MYFPPHLPRKLLGGLTEMADPHQALKRSWGVMENGSPGVKRKNQLVGSQQPPL